ncbi:lytic transglycosylase domain-containing protein [Noviherbaspirillum denitrificans]|uniref:Transglycosylase SLT domain-containing protein n=1 Tax=Noviherbaspirillum denitrificans TaxID=1968433 RepID=A0A254TFQ8_9BURK|nr:lytic transglycosylase domain-containing protein [Noviherbaspirillum denitrificans]OWW21489.1 hypothetical protein AYR66_20360 [Noviherbaspirillum denitrificans]
MCSINASARAATAARLFAIFIFTAVLAACAGPFPLVQQGTDAQDPPPAPQSARNKRVRAQDVLAEWGTFGVAPRTFRYTRPAVPRAMAPSTDYSESIQDIVDNATCHACEAKPYHRMVVNASLQHGVPPSLIHAVIQKESRYNPKARSKKNARGLMQVTPATARFVGVSSGQSLFDPQTNIHAGTAYLKYLMGTHATFDEVLAAYNSGPGNVRKYNGVPPFNETQRYVRDVRKFYAASAGDEP